MNECHLDNIIAQMKQNFNCISFEIIDKNNIWYCVDKPFEC